MNNKLNVLVTAFLALWLVFGVTACSDNSSSSDDDGEDICNSFSLPSELAPATIAIEYFDSQNVQDDEEHAVYQQVKTLATTGSAQLSFGGNAALISSFLQFAPGLNIQPEAEGGNCIWNIDFAENFPQFDIDASIRVIASQSGDRINWQVLLSGDLEGQQVDNFLFLEGFTANDQATGEWNGYDPENPDEPSYTYTWDIESEEEYQLNLDGYQGGELVLSVNYDKNGVENNMILTQPGTGTTEIFWNEETDSGWIEPEGGDRMCYTDFLNSACS
jgi:hypothetical protein